MHSRPQVGIATAFDPACGEACEVIRRLASLAGESFGRVEADGTEILLDLQCDGLRSLLIRTPQDNLALALSPREREIARLVADGHSNKIVADILEISAWTVGTHIRRIFAKLGSTVGQPW